MNPRADGPALLAQAMDHHRRGEVDRAEPLYRRILDADPQAVDAAHLLGVLALSAGRAEEAAALIARAVAIVPTFSAAQTNLGHALRLCGRLDEASRAYERAIALDGSQQARAGLDSIAQNRQYLESLRTTLDQEYRASRWSYLDNISETARYGVVSAYVRATAPAGPLLDLGCGEGTLYPHLPHGAVSEYMGVDISAEALAKHRAHTAKAGPARLVRSALELFLPPAEMRFAAIVFNEVLLYVLDPLASLRRFRANLAPDGIMIVSWYRMKSQDDQIRKEEATWTALQAPEWGMKDMSVLQNATHDLTWRIAVMRPVNDPSAG